MLEEKAKGKAVSQVVAGDLEEVEERARDKKTRRHKYLIRSGVTEVTKTIVAMRFWMIFIMMERVMDEQTKQTQKTMRTTSLLVRSNQSIRVQ